MGSAPQDGDSLLVKAAMWNFMRVWERAQNSQVLKAHLLMNKLTADSQTSSARVLHATPNDGKIYFRNVQGTSLDVIFIIIICAPKCNILCVAADTMSAQCPGSGHSRLWKTVGRGLLGSCKGWEPLWKHPPATNIGVLSHRWIYIEHKRFNFHGIIDLCSCPPKYVGKRGSDSWVIGIRGGRCCI